MAVQFITNGDNITNATDATFFASATVPQSITVWINALWDGNVKTSSMVGMYQAAGGTGATAIQIGSRVAAGQCDIWTWGGGIMVSSTGVTIPASTWVNITYTYDGTSHRLYYNGTLNNTVVNGTAPNVPQIVGSFNAVYMNGFAAGGVSETADFIVDTYYYYNRTLTSNEVQTIYAARGNRHGIVYGSLLRYEFDEEVLGSNVVKVVNQTLYEHAISDLLPANARLPRVTYAAGSVSSNLRVPLGING
jgi:hypothetical protein